MNASSLQMSFIRIRSNKLFEIFVVSVIVFSALLVGAKTYEMTGVMYNMTVFLDWFISAFSSSKSLFVFWPNIEREIFSKISGTFSIP